MGASARLGGLTPAIAERRKARKDARALVELKLRSVLEQHAPDLFAGRENAGLDANTLGTILQQVQDDGDLDSLRSTRRLLRDILIAMQKVSGGDVQLPAPEVTLHRQPSPFRPQMFRNLPWLSAVIEEFLADLEKQPGASDEIAAARILFAAIVFGGLINQTLVSRFPAALSANLSQYSGQCWLEIPLYAKNEESRERIRRWFPEPASQCLIARWLHDEKSWPEGKQGTPDHLVRSLLNHLKVSRAPASNSPLRGLLAVAQTRLRLHLPGLLVDFLASAEHGESVSTRTWWRLLADHHLAAKEIDLGEQEAADEICAIAEHPETEPTKHIDDSSQDLQAVKILKKSLTRGSGYLKPTAALRTVAALRQSLGPRGPMFTALLDWTEWRLLMLSSGTQRAQPQSVHRYLVSFAHVLIAAAGEIDPVATPPAELQAKYQEALSSVRTDGERALAAKRLRNFHSFLVLTRDVAPVEIDGISSGKQRVRTNVISDVEYERTLGLIDRSELDPRTRAMLRVMLIVAYRLGPRRRELAYLRLNDMHDGSGTGAISARPLLWIHSHPDARLKTGNSIRRLPLAHLLTWDELNELRAWKQHRVVACGANRPAQALLFCAEGRDTERLPDAEIDILVEMLRHVCKDDTIVLHTLRHSFLSNTFVRLMLAELEVDEAGREPCLWLTETGRSQDFLRRVFNANALPREAAYLLCTLAGHLDPTETMHTYVHFQDWISGLFLRELAADWPVSRWAALEGIRPDALMVRHSREKKRTGLPVQAHLDTPRRLVKELKLALPEGSPAEIVPAPMPAAPDPRSRLERLPLEGIYCLIALAGRSMSHQAREHVTGIDRHVFEQLRTAALQVASTKTATRNLQARRPRFLADRKAQRRRPRLCRLPQLDGIAPAIPRERSERNDAREVYRQAFDLDKPISQEALQSILDRTSHSDPTIVSTTMEDLVSTIEVLKQLGIPRFRLVLEIRSLPRSAIPVDKWILEVAKRTGIPDDAIESAGIETPVTCSARTHPAGVIAVKVIQPASTLNASSPTSSSLLAPRLAYGWRVGCFYALCVKRSLGSAAI